MPMHQNALPRPAKSGSWAFSAEQAQIARQYVGYIDKLEAGQTGRLTAYPVT